MKAPAYKPGLFLICNMNVIADMILAVTVIAVTSGTIPELPLGIGYICLAAYCTAVSIGFFCCGFCGFM